MRYLLFLLALPLLSQTRIDPQQVTPCASTGNYFLMSVSGQTVCVYADPATFRVSKTPNNPFGWQVEAIAPAVDALTARVSTLETQVAALAAQQPVADVFVSTTAGQTFTPSATPKWGYIEVVRNGVVQSSEKDYNFSGGVVTFLGGLPTPNDIVRLQYWK